jgi:hypothetical protein
VAYQAHRQRSVVITTRPFSRFAAAAALVLVGLLGGGTAQAASSVAQGEPAGHADAVAALLAELRPEAESSKYDAAAMRGEHVASFVEARSKAGGPVADRAAFEAWRADAINDAAAQANGRDVLWERTVSRFQRQLERTFADRGMPWPGERLAFGALVTGNALPVLLEIPRTGTRVVVFDERLFDLVYAIVSAAFSGRPDGVATSCDTLLSTLPSPARPRFGWAMRMFVRGKHDGRYDLAPARPVELMALVRAAELFAIAHEYAHVALDHAPARGGADIVEQRLNVPVSTAVLRYSSSQELAADALAFDLVQQTIRTSGSEPEKALAPFGPEVMMFVAEILERARAVYDGDALVASDASVEPSTSLALLTARRAALHDAARLARRSAPDTASWEAASLVERTASCILSSVSPGLAIAGANGRYVDKTIGEARAALMAKIGPSALAGR